jgi:hypothetical protein
MVHLPQGFPQKSTGKNHPKTAGNRPLPRRILSYRRPTGERPPNAGKIFHRKAQSWPARKPHCLAGNRTTWVDGSRPLLLFRLSSARSLSLSLSLGFTPSHLHLSSIDLSLISNLTLSVSLLLSLPASDIRRKNEKEEGRRRRRETRRRNNKRRRQLAVQVVLFFFFLFLTAC